MKKRIVAIALLVTATMSTMALLAGCGSESAQTKSSLTSSTVSQSTGEQADNSETAALPVGDTCTVGNFEITVTDFSYASRVNANEYFGHEADEGSVFAMAGMKIKNVGTEADTFAPSFGYGDMIHVKIIYDGQYTYSGTNLLSMDEDLHDEHVNPLESKSGFLAFSVPEEIKTSKKPLVLEISAGTDSVQYDLR